jgi:hypothetical protein
LKQFRSHYLLAISLYLSSCCAFAASEQPDTTTEFDYEIESPPKVEDEPKRPDHLIGLGASIPDVVTLRYARQTQRGDRFGIFIAPPLPIRVAYTIPGQDIAARGGFKVGTPPVDAFLEVQYGPSIGVEFAWHPFAGRWFISPQLSYRQLAARGSAKTPLLICSAASRATCSSQRATIVTRTEFGIDMTYYSDTVLARLGTGWDWTIFNRVFTALELGVAYPVLVTSRINSNIEIDSGLGTATPAITGALAVLEDSYERETQTSAAAALAPYERAMLPIIGLVLGYQW